MMNSFFKNAIIYPFLMAVYPILFLYSQNIDQVEFAVILLPLIYSVLASYFIFFLLNFLLKNKAKAGLIVFVLLIFFFSYGRAFAIMWDNFAGSILFNNYLYFHIVYFGLLLIVYQWLLFNRRNLHKATLFLNIFTTALLIMVFINIGLYYVSDGANPIEEYDDMNCEISNLTNRSSELVELPDIYYIVLDAYAREDILMQIYDYDNREFINSLEDRGFYVASKSNSNYHVTFLSLASSLNMQYVNFFSDAYGKDSINRSIPYEMIADANVARLLKGIGYKHIHFQTSYNATTYNKYADVNYAYSSENEFIGILINSTVLGLMMQKDIFTREGVLYTFNKIPQVAEGFEEPVFVFAHIIPPRFPFLFGKEGEEVDQTQISELWDKEYYIDQLIYINTKVIKMIDSILDTSETAPIIIIQSDHGPGLIIDRDGGAGGVTYRKFEQGKGCEGIQERMGILNSYYLPNKDIAKSGLYEYITPVNSFRIIFNNYFNTELELLDDVIYFAPFSTPYAFIDVTECVFDYD